MKVAGVVELAMPTVGDFSLDDLDARLVIGPGCGYLDGKEGEDQAEDQEGEDGQWEGFGASGHGWSEGALGTYDLYAANLSGLFWFSI